MNHYKHNTAILLFARTADYESRHKNFQSGISLKKNKEVSELLFKAAHVKCLSSGIPVHHIDESMQKGFNFAERLKKSFSHVFELGYDHVIAVGNDCPTLSVEDILKARQALENDRCVIGRTQRGGVYILGLSKRQHYSFLFDKVEWGTRRVYEQISSQLSSQFHVVNLKARGEVNQLADLETVYFSGFNKLVKRLRSFLTPENYTPSERDSSIHIFLRAQERFRGPPPRTCML